MYKYDPIDDIYKDASMNFVATDARVVSIGTVTGGGLQMVISSDAGAKQANAYKWENGRFTGNYKISLPFFFFFSFVLVKLCTNKTHLTTKKINSDPFSNHGMGCK